MGSRDRVTVQIVIRISEEFGQVGAIDEGGSLGRYYDQSGG